MKQKRQLFVSRQVKWMETQGLPLKVKNQFDQELLKRRILAVADPEKCLGGYDALEIGIRVGAARAKELYGQKYRSYQQVEEDLRHLSALCRQSREIVDRLQAANIISQEILDQIILAEKSWDDPFRLTDQDRISWLEVGEVPYESRVAAADPMSALSDASLFMEYAAEEQLSSLPKEFGTFSYSRRPESDALGKAVYELHRRFGRDSVSYPGSNSGAPALLYCELCRLTGIPEGDPESILRKFQRQDST